MAAQKLFGCFIQTQDGRKYIGNGSKHIIELRDNTQYGIGIDNKSNLRCSAQIEINGVKLAGNFYARPYERSTIHFWYKSFVFVSTSSDIAKEGQIHVSIRPEKPEFVAAAGVGGPKIRYHTSYFQYCDDDGPSFETQGCHNFYFMLRVGNPNRNTLYEGPTDGMPYPYSVIE